MKAMKLVLGSAFLIAMIGVGFFFGTFQVKAKPEMSEVIDLGVHLDSTRIEPPYQKTNAGLASNDMGDESFENDELKTERSLEVILLQLDALNKQVTQLQSKVQELSDARDSINNQYGEPVSLPRQSEQQLAELEQQHINAIFTETHHALNAEAFDADWTTIVNDSISQLINEHQLAGTFVRDLQCGSTLCAVLLQQSELNTASTNVLLENLAWHGFRLKKRDRYSIDGTSDVEVLIGRDGREFEGNTQG